MALPTIQIKASRRDVTGSAANRRHDGHPTTRSRPEAARSRR